MTAPLTRTVEQFSGDVVPAAALADRLGGGLPVASEQLDAIATAQREAAVLREQLTNSRNELDDVMVAFRGLGETVAGLTSMTNLYHTERDSAREDAEVLRGRVAELEAQLGRVTDR